MHDEMWVFMLSLQLFSFDHFDVSQLMLLMINMYTIGFFFCLTLISNQVTAQEYEIEIALNIPEDSDLSTEEIQEDIQEALIQASIIVRYDITSDDDISLTDFEAWEDDDLEDEGYDADESVGFFVLLTLPSEDIAERWAIDMDYITDEAANWIADEWDIDDADDLEFYLDFDIDIDDDTDSDTTSDDEQDDSTGVSIDQLFILFTIVCLSLCFITTIISCIDKVYNKNELFELGSLVLFVTYVLDFFSGLFVYI